MSTVTTTEVKSRLRKSSTADDTKIQAMIDAAEAEYLEWVGPITGSVTEILDGGFDTLILRDPGATAITAASYESGDTLTYTELNVSNGIVRWDYSTVGRFNPGRVSITYTVGALPANHREAIIADVAGYFSVTQRSGVDPRADFPGEGFADSTFIPGVLFPRIRALAGPSVA